MGFLETDPGTSGHARITKPDTVVIAAVAHDGKVEGHDLLDFRIGVLIAEQLRWKIGDHLRLLEGDDVDLGKAVIQLAPPGTRHRTLSRYGSLGVRWRWPIEAFSRHQLRLAADSGPYTSECKAFGGQLFVTLPPWFPPLPKLQTSAPQPSLSLNGA